MVSLPESKTAIIKPSIVPVVPGAVSRVFPIELTCVPLDVVRSHDAWVVTRLVRDNDSPALSITVLKVAHDKEDILRVAAIFK